MNLHFNLSFLVLNACRRNYPVFFIQLKEAEMKYEVVCPFTEGNAGDLAKNLPAEAKRAHPTLMDDLLATPPLSSKGRCHLYQRTCHGCDSGKTFESPIGFYRCAVDDGW